MFVDAGYLLADGALAAHGTRHRESVSWDYPGLLKLLTGLCKDRTGLPLLRCYWYEATVEGRRTTDHDVLADLPGLKLRLARIRPGRREGVDAQVHRDLMTLARNNAVCDAVVVSGDEDLAQVVSDAQDLGIRVTVIHVAVEGGWAVSRALRQECDDLIEIGGDELRPYATLNAEQASVQGNGQAPALNGQSRQNGSGRLTGAHSANGALGGSFANGTMGAFGGGTPNGGSSDGNVVAGSGGGAASAPSSGAAHAQPALPASAPSSGAAHAQPALPASAPSSGAAHAQPALPAYAAYTPDPQPAQLPAPTPIPAPATPSVSMPGPIQTPPPAHGAPQAAPPVSSPPQSSPPVQISSLAPASPPLPAPLSTPPGQQASSAPAHAQSHHSASSGSYSGASGSAYPSPGPVPLGPYTGPQPTHVASHSAGNATTLAESVQSAHKEGFDFGESVARDAPVLWLEAVLARKPRMPSDLEARLLQGSSLPIDFLLHEEVRQALRRGFWDALERARH
ncbi:NYN domain-containing protein [Microtetraspora fusca]|uniref:NYN domain-containing protein n=1 Tax=Microtetraspora fusca TaxID=1997 RepID=A0ABW6V8E4_MICFU